jgi:hypothetical protein
MDPGTECGSVSFAAGEDLLVLRLRQGACVGDAQSSARFGGAPLVTVPSSVHRLPEAVLQIPPAAGLTGTPQNDNGAPGYGTPLTETKSI